VSGEPDNRDWSHASESLFRASRTDHDATSADRARVRRALARRLAGGAALTAGAGARAAARRSFQAASLGKGLLVALGVACVAAGALVFTGDRRHPARSVATTSVASAQPTSSDEPREPIVQRGTTKSPAPDESVPSVAATNAAPSRAALRSGGPKRATSASDAPPRSDPQASIADTSRNQSVAEARTPPAEPTDRATAPSPDPTRTAELDDSRAELALVRRIHLAMQSENPLGALALCAEHARRWPHGTFVQEREGVRAIALCETRSSAAGTRARAFLANYPRAPLAPRVAAACASELGAPAESAATPGVH